jgi:hypothetical protein
MKALGTLAAGLLLMACDLPTPPPKEPLNLAVSAASPVPIASGAGVAVHSPKDSPATIQVDNDSDAPVSFATAVEVLELDKKSGIWSKSSASMSLGEGCIVDTSGCTTVLPHHHLKTMALSPGCAQCTKCSVVLTQPVTYKYRISPCPGGKPNVSTEYGVTHTTEAFTMDTSGAVTQRE